MAQLHWRRLFVVLAVLLMAGAPASANMVISLTSGSSLSSNTDALAAFNRAIATWEALFTDSITINITADFGSLGSGVLGSTSAVSSTVSYADLRSFLVADETGYANQAVTDALPGSLTVSLPSGFTYSGNAQVTKANLKALGYAGADSTPDGTLTFSNTYSFDFDNSDGVTGIDFESVVLHEIGHVLGFISSVDRVDQLSSGSISVRPIDLFRIAASTTLTDLASFTSATRELTPGVEANFADSVVSYAMSTGSSKGDGHQASHWKADEITGTNIGLFDPTLASGVIQGLTFADIYALDVTGYDLIQTPEPATFGLMAGALVWFAMRRRRCR